ncbi:MAG: hypothetical protein NVSMB9_06260 [Isosphaeraceae bacterium]
MPRPSPVHVFGPAYLDRVLLVDRPLAGHGESPWDQSVDGSLGFGSDLLIRDEKGSTLVVDLPLGWPGPRGVVEVKGRLGEGSGTWARSVRALSWHDDLGGMGAGFAAALDGDLVSALGDEDDPISQAVSTRLARAGVRHRPIRVSGRETDWTLLVTSGPFGDKLPIGFRGCHAAIQSVSEQAEEAGPCDLRVVASFPNRLAAQALRAPGARVRLFAPAMRNMTDHAFPLGLFVDSIDVLCCNRREWESLEDRQRVGEKLSILAVTNGPAGSLVRFTNPQGEAESLEAPAFPRTHPPRDTNRAGEAFAATLISELRRGGWSPGVSEGSLIRHAMQRASIAAALVLDRSDFGFPAPGEIETAWRVGKVENQVRGGGFAPSYNAGE